MRLAVFSKRTGKTACTAAVAATNSQNENAPAKRACSR